MQRIGSVCAVVALAGALGACSDESGGEEGTTGSDPSTSTPAEPVEWETVVPGGDCQCSDGSEFSFQVREADPDKVVFFLQDGGACLSAETCDPEEDLYNVAVDEGPDGEDGILDFANESNPFADYSFVYVPYCSADVFLGNATTEYAAGLTIQHKGYANANAALDLLAERFPDATEAVVIGESAGSVAAPLYGGLVAERLPDARVTVLADGSGSYPDDPKLTGVVGEAWNIESVVPGWGSFPELFARSAQQDPNIVFARHDYAYDDRQAMWYPHLGIEMGDLLDRIDANEAQIEGAGVDLLSYIAPGEGHTVLTEREFYDREVGGVRILDWVTQLIAGEPVEDVHCTECAAGGG
jgi:hypothetical protein